MNSNGENGMSCESLSMISQLIHAVDSEGCDSIREKSKYICGCEISSAPTSTPTSIPTLVPTSTPTSTPTSLTPTVYNEDNIKCTLCTNGEEVPTEYLNDKVLGNDTCSKLANDALLF
jgi:hypothetical protein